MTNGSDLVLVTGGTGYVGGWCLVELLRRGYRVRTTVRAPAKEAAVRAAVVSADVPVDRLSFAIADLGADAGWAEAAAGCRYVLHVASPLGGAPANDRDALVAPARDGTLRVLRAAVDAKVERVVMTSAAATARTPRDSGAVSDETVWADPDDRRFDAYRRSKILAERAAWDFLAGAGSATTLTTILPGAVFGPVLSRDNLGSVQIIQRLLDGKLPALPRLGFWVVDVRDLAALHVDAMTSPAAAGERFLAAGDFLWMKELAAILRDRLGADARKVPTRTMPDLLVRTLSVFAPSLRALAPELGRRNDLTSRKARERLGFAPRPVVETLTDCARSLLAPTAT